MKLDRHVTTHLKANDPLYTQPVVFYKHVHSFSIIVFGFDADIQSLLMLIHPDLREYQFLSQPFSYHLRISLCP